MRARAERCKTGTGHHKLGKTKYIRSNGCICPIYWRYVRHKYEIWVIVISFQIIVECLMRMRHILKRQLRFIIILVWYIYLSIIIFSNYKYVSYYIRTYFLTESSVTSEFTSTYNKTTSLYCYSSHHILMSYMNRHILKGHFLFMLINLLYIYLFIHNHIL